MPTEGEYSFFDEISVTPNAIDLSAGEDKVAEPDKSFEGDQSAPLVPDITPIVEECEKIKRDVEAAIYGSISECLDACQTIGGECNACVQGRVQILLDQIQAVGNKCGEKVIGGLYNTLINTANAMETIGIPKPTPDQLAAAANGDEIPPSPPPPEPMTPEEITESVNGTATDIVNGVLNGTLPPPVLTPDTNTYTPPPINGGKFVRPKEQSDATSPTQPTNDSDVGPPTGGFPRGPDDPQPVPPLTNTHVGYYWVCDEFSGRWEAYFDGTNWHHATGSGLIPGEANTVRPIIGPYSDRTSLHIAWSNFNG